MSYTPHENIEESQETSESAYILINEPKKIQENRNKFRAQTSNNFRVVKLNNPLFNP